MPHIFGDYKLCILLEVCRTEWHNFNAYRIANTSFFPSDFILLIFYDTVFIDFIIYVVSLKMN